MKTKQIRRSLIIMNVIKIYSTPEIIYFYITYKNMST